MNRQKIKFSEIGITLALILEVIIFSQLSPFFLTAENLLNVTLQVSIISIIAVGMTFVILTAGIDLSVGSLVAFVGVISTSLLKLNIPLSFSFAIAITVGVIIGITSGSIAGLFITRFRIAPFIVTLALMTIWRGLAFIYTEGRPVWELPDEFSFLGSGRIFGIPLPTIIMIVIFILAYITLTQTKFGRYVYAVGGNAEAARLAGIRTNLVIAK
ncbi:MAG: ribose ABC transporter permease, partial [Ignavibacteria bacterium]|nr:ribose ABC transporter permease [Ignavibacteria bacterium]